MGGAVRELVGKGAEWVRRRSLGVEGERGNTELKEERVG